MNGIVFRRNDKLVFAGGGFNGRCKLYELKTKLAVLNGHLQHNGCSSEMDQHSSGSFSDSILRRRTSSVSSERNSNIENFDRCNGSRSNGIGINDHDIPQIGYDIELAGEFEADKNEKLEPFLKVVRYSADQDILVTGGSDGHIRVWQLSSDDDIKCVRDIGAHSDEIDDLDIDPSGRQIASASLDGTAYVWELSSGKRLFKLELIIPSRDPIKPVKYRLRRCRYSTRRGSTTLVATLLPVVMRKPPDPCFICQWDTARMALEKRIHAGYDNLTNLTISEDGRFLGTGSLSGTVTVYNAHDFTQLYRLENSHKSFVTGVQFLKCSPTTQIMAGDNEASLVTISVDNKIIVHHVSKPGEWKIFIENNLKKFNCTPDPYAFLESSLLFVVILILVYFITDLFGL